jgi:hypothetical protein
LFSAETVLGHAPPEPFFAAMMAGALDGTKMDSAARLPYAETVQNEPGAEYFLNLRFILGYARKESASCVLRQTIR